MVTFIGVALKADFTVVRCRGVDREDYSERLIGNESACKVKVSVFCGGGRGERGEMGFVGKRLARARMNPLGAELSEVVRPRAII